MFVGHIFDLVYKVHGIEHQLTKSYHPLTNGLAERMNCTIKGATSIAFHYPSLDARRGHVLVFVLAYNFAKHLKALQWHTPFQSTCEVWQRDLSALKINLHHLIPGQNTLESLRLSRQWAMSLLASYIAGGVRNHLSSYDDRQRLGRLTF